MGDTLGEKTLRMTRPQVCRVVREMLPQERLGTEGLLRLLEAQQLRNYRASRSHAKRRAAPQTSEGTPPFPITTIDTPACSPAPTRCFPIFDG